MSCDAGRKRGVGAVNYRLSGAERGKSEQDSLCTPEYYGDEDAGA